MGYLWLTYTKKSFISNSDLTQCTSFCFCLFGLVRQSDLEVFFCLMLQLLNIWVYHVTLYFFLLNISWQWLGWIAGADTGQMTALFQ